MFEKSKGIPELVKQRLLDQIPRPLKTKKVRVKKVLQEKPLAAGIDSHESVDSVDINRRSLELPYGEDGDNKSLGRDDVDTIDIKYHPKRRRKIGFFECRTLYTRKPQRLYRSWKFKFSQIFIYNERCRRSQAEQPKKYRTQLCVKEKKRKRRKITPRIKVK
jgi:hypothetical protein